MHKIFSLLASLGIATTGATSVMAMAPNQNLNDDLQIGFNWSFDEANFEVENFVDLSSFCIIQIKTDANNITSHYNAYNSYLEVKYGELKGAKKYNIDFSKFSSVKIANVNDEATFFHHTDSSDRYSYNINELIKNASKDFITDNIPVSTNPYNMAGRGDYKNFEDEITQFLAFYKFDIGFRVNINDGKQYFEVGNFAESGLGLTDGADGGIKNLSEISLMCYY